MFQLYEDTFPYPKRKEKEKLPEIKKKEKEKRKKVQWIHCIFWNYRFFKITIIVTPCKGIRIPESGKFRLVESWILEKFVVESGILGYIIQLKESGIPGFKSRIQDYVRFPYMMQLLQIKRIWSNPFKNGTILNYPTDSVLSFTCDVIALKPRPNEDDSVRKRSQKNAKTMKSWGEIQIKTLLPFLLSKPTILSALLKNLPTKMKSSRCTTK